MAPLARLRRSRPLPLSVVTGFLGSGKTTVLNHMLGRKGMRSTAVIVNEFGEVGLDHLLVEAADEQMVTLSRGCVCCTVRGDLLTTLRALFERRERREVPRFRRILVETTGLADPAPMIHALLASPAARARVYLDTVLATVDAVNAITTLARHPEAGTQVAMADAVAITKLDLADADRLPAVRAAISALNPGAAVSEIEGGAVPPAALFGRRVFDARARSPAVAAWLADVAVLARADAPAHRHGGDIQVFCVTRDQPLGFAAFRSFCDALSSIRGDDLLRLKGLVAIREQPDAPVVVHGVQHVIHAPRSLRRWPSPDRRTRLVFITRGISQGDIECLLAGAERGAGAAELYRRA